MHILGAGKQEGEAEDEDDDDALRE